MKTIEITQLENEVLVALASGMYAEPGFTDVNLDELISNIPNLSTKKLRGVLSSLIKKELIYIFDCSEDNCDRWKDVIVDGKMMTIANPTGATIREQTYYGLTADSCHLTDMPEWVAESNHTTLVIK